MNYGAIGSVVGHELTHAFDHRGALYYKDGQRKKWWSAEDLAKFNEKSQCFVEQYGALREPLSRKVLNGAQTLAENIADNGGVKKAFTAYREHQKALGGRRPSEVLPGALKLTADQLFFTSYAHSLCENVTPEEARRRINSDPHSPNRFRVNVVLGNMPAFATAFQCPLGSAMNPVKKCSLW
ncbi:PREDICTED: neprilysin-1-like [Rhagoletis zephyria]|uniref:neprilysin-1-like n=1 Tax=Rhagoletis zephyria TaxID=28612 RepID=UPI0008118383|nr:PREDICTED: neprilysin-1-like [Rhagoletis zephyria]